MKIEIRAIGRLKAGPEREIFNRYQKRFGQIGKNLGFAPLTLAEHSESHAGAATSRKREEAAKLLPASADGRAFFALHETGRSLSSKQFAEHLLRQQELGTPTLAFLIGGPDGLDPKLRAATSNQISLSPMTLTHGFARLLLVEQLYRAMTMLARHPYHRK